LSYYGTMTSADFSQ